MEDTAKPALVEEIAKPALVEDVALPENVTAEIVLPVALTPDNT